MVRKQRRVVSWAFAILGLILSVSSADARSSEGPPPVLHITTYHSPSNHYSLTVDPSRLHGGGPGSYRVELDGKLVWEKEIEFTFWEAAITDDGSAVGYAYTSGWRGFDGARDGDFIVAILNPDGTTKFIDRKARDEVTMMHSPPGPTASGCFLDSANHRFIVRFRSGGVNEMGERWTVFDIPQGKRMDDIALASPKVQTPRAGDSELWYHAVDVHQVPGTDLVFVAWVRTQWRPSEEGIRLSLVDAKAQEVWSTERVKEFASFEHFTPWYVPLLKFVPLPTNQSFSFRSPADQSRITYSLTRAEAEPGVWLVKETSRVAEAVPTKWGEEKQPPLPTVTLAPLGVVTLEAGKDTDAQSLNVFDFEFDKKGRIGFIPRAAGGQLEFVLYSSDGKKEKGIPIVGPEMKDANVPRAICVGEDSWILLNCPAGDDSVPRGFTLNAASGTLAPIKDFDCPRTFQQTMKGTSGRFAVLGDYRDSRAMMFDQTGTKLWTSPDPVFSSQDIAINSRGELGALGGIRNQIAVYDSSGKLVRTIELNSTLGKTPNYVAGLEADADGGWILNDFGGNPLVYRLDADGKVLSKFTPRFEDGREFRLYGNVKRAPDGRLWTSDGASLLRLTDAGVVDFVIGRNPKTTALSEIRCVGLDSKGNIYAVDASNAFVHVFDTQGKFLRFLKPDPTDFSTDAGLGAITVAGDGAVYYQPTTHGLSNKGYLRLNADGTRAGFQKGISGEVVDEWVFKPASGERLVLGYERAFLTDAEGNKTRTIERRADRRWLDKPEHAAFAPDGSFAIFARPSSWSSGDSVSVTLFSAAGDAVKTFDLPSSISFPRGATNGRTIVSMMGTSAVVIDVASGVMKQWTLPPETEKSWWEPFISPDGKELVCIDREKKSLHRFAMP